MTGIGEIIPAVSSLLAAPALARYDVVAPVHVPRRAAGHPPANVA